MILWNFEEKRTEQCFLLKEKNGFEYCNKNRFREKYLGCK